MEIFSKDNSKMKKKNGFGTFKQAGGGIYQGEYKNG